MEPGGQLAFAVWITTRTSHKGLAALRMAFGCAVDQALQLPGEWLVGVLGHGGRGLMNVATELELLEVSGVLMNLPGPQGRHIEAFMYIPRELQRRVVETTRSEELRAMPAAGRA